MQRPIDSRSTGAAVLQDYAQRWSLQPRGAGFETNSSWLQRVHAPEPAVLKVAKPGSDERPGMALLAWWKGQGAVSVLNRDTDAILMVEAAEDPALSDASAFDDLRSVRHTGPDRRRLAPWQSPLSRSTARGVGAAHGCARPCFHPRRDWAGVL